MIEWAHKTVAIKNRFGMVWMPTAATRMYGQRSECADLSELLHKTYNEDTC